MTITIRGIQVLEAHGMNPRREHLHIFLFLQKICRAPLRYRFGLFFNLPQTVELGDERGILSRLLVQSLIEEAYQPNYGEYFKIAEKGKKQALHHTEILDAITSAADFLAEYMSRRSTKELCREASALHLIKTYHKKSKDQIIHDICHQQGALKGDTLKEEQMAAQEAVGTALSLKEKAVAHDFPKKMKSLTPIVQQTGTELAESLRASMEHWTVHRKSIDGSHLISMPFWLGGDPVDLGFTLRDGKAVIEDSGEIARIMHSLDRADDSLLEQLFWFLVKNIGLEVDYDAGVVKLTVPEEDLYEGAEELLKVIITLAMSGDFLTMKAAREAGPKT